MQLESGALYESTENRSYSTSKTLLPTNLFRIGITNWMELRLLNQVESIKRFDRRYTGVSDLEVGTKIQLLKKENVNTEIAFLSHLIVPTGSTRFTNSHYGSINKVSISHKLGEQFGLGYNIGYNYINNINGDLTYSLALGFTVSSKVQVYIEPYGELTDMKDYISNIDGGFVYLANDNLQYDFSFGTGLNYRMNYISVGFSWLVGK